MRQVGDEAACRTAFAALQARVAELSAADCAVLPAGAANPWQALVPRFRALRESLTSEGVGGALALSAYECAAEACLRADDAGEYLKCQCRLLQELYPQQQAPPARWAEFAACGVLYWACAGAAAGPAELTAALRTTPPHLLRTPHVRCALSALGALARRDGAAFCAAAVAADATPLMRLVMARRLPQARAEALAAASRAFRTLPVGAAARMLRMPPDGLPAALAAAAALAGAPPPLQLAARDFAAAAQAPTELRFVAAAPG